MGGGDKRLIEVLDGSQSYEIGMLRERLGSCVKDSEIGEFKGAANFAQEGGFLAVAFDQSELELQRPILEGQARESGTAADVDCGEARIAWAELAGGEKRLAEVACDHLFGGAQRGEVHTLVPADEK